MSDVSQETATASSGAVICHVPVNILKVTGKDRASFLHNFCTQQIKELPTGQCAETTFTNVKARMIDHGYVLASEKSHIIVTLTADGDKLQQHLDRYIITEDVQLAAEQQTSVVVIGRDAFLAMSEHLNQPLTSLACDATNGQWLATSWNDFPMVWLFDGIANDQAIFSNLQTASLETFNHIRICEGFPLAGVDVTEDNLAPEANRIQQSISYTKGCYLGQEPIARLDAMGSVNRQLYRIDISESSNPETEPAATVTSQSQPVAGRVSALVMARVKDVASGELIVRLSDGRLASANVITD